jgi:hypothetical protein
LRSPPHRTSNQLSRPSLYALMSGVELFGVLLSNSPVAWLRSRLPPRACGRLDLRSLPTSGAALGQRAEELLSSTSVWDALPLGPSFQDRDTDFEEGGIHLRVVYSRVGTRKDAVHLKLRFWTGATSSRKLVSTLE